MNISLHFENWAGAWSPKLRRPGCSNDDVIASVIRELPVHSQGKGGRVISMGT